MMDMTWIQIFILTFSECVAPAGKTVCQEQGFELTFLNRRDCEYALQQMIAIKDEADYVIVNRDKSRCVPSAAEVKSHDEPDAIASGLADAAGWRSPTSVDARRAAVRQNHDERLSALRTCEETNGRAPCRIGDIIVEAASGDSVDVWRKD